MSGTIKIERPRNPFEGRNQPTVVAEVLGWNDTHVIINVFIDGKLATERLNRPIERFMCQYGLNAF